jgi:hypothetical protein
MGVIGLGVDLNARRVEIPKNAANVCVQVGTDIVTESSLSVFGGEDEMNLNLGERLGHNPASPEPLQGSWSFSTLTQGGTLKLSLPGLGSCGPSGRNSTVSPLSPKEVTTSNHQIAVLRTTRPFKKSVLPGGRFEPVGGRLEQPAAAPPEGLAGSQPKVEQGSACGEQNLRY